MKKILLIVSMIAFSSNIIAQYTKSVIANTNSSGAYGILEKDIDGNAYLDLVCAAQTSNVVSYYINNGNNTFTEHIVDNALIGATYADAYDLDGDGDLDFVAVGSAEMAWYENNGSFVFTKHHIANLNHATFVRAYDADNDGDGDIGVSIYGENYIAAFLNNGSGTFTRLNAISINTPKIFHGGDFEGDGNGDILASSFTGNKIEWYKFVNSIIPHFSLGGTVATGFNGAFGVEGVDVDGDTDYDVIAAAYTDNEIAWFENTDGTGTSFTKHSIDTNFIGASFVHWVDVDGDGDGDIVATAHGNGTTGSVIAIYYNDGNQNFSKIIIDNTENGYQMFTVQDFDDNGSQDIAYAADLSNKFVLLTSLGSDIATQNHTMFSVYPNPANDIINIVSEHSINSVRVFDISGRTLLTTSNTMVNISGLPVGNYLLQVTFANGSASTERFVVKY